MVEFEIVVGAVYSTRIDTIRILKGIVPLASLAAYSRAKSNAAVGISGRYRFTLISIRTKRESRIDRRRLPCQAMISPLCYDINYTTQGVCAVNRRVSALQEFYAFDVIRRDNSDIE